MPQDNFDWTALIGLGEQALQENPQFRMNSPGNEDKTLDHNSG
jgi:hypothetical protein